MTTTSDHPQLFDPFPPFATPEHTGAATIQDRFVAFHAANPWVARELIRLTRAYRAKRPYSRVGVKHLVEVLRWEWAMTTDSSDGFKINNSYASRYARLIAETEPDLADAFELRELKAE